MCPRAPGPLAGGGHAAAETAMAGHAKALRTNVPRRARPHALLPREPATEPAAQAAGQHYSAAADQHPHEASRGCRKGCA